jgi:hypothetical protein
MRRSLLGVLLVALFPIRAAAQGYGGGGGEASSGYSIVRWDEDYSYLKDPSQRTDFFDPIKYIPIDDNPDAYVSFGGQVRYRYDYFNNNEFGAGPREAGFNLIRMLVHGDLHINQYIRAFLQLDSSLEYNRSGGPRTGDADDIDFQQAFLDFTLPLDPDAVVVRVGRQELIYGAQRLVSPNDWRNVRQSFDGAKITANLPNDTLEAFLTRPVIPNKSHLNSSDDNTYFGGIYNVTELPRVLPDAHSKLDLYLFSLNKAATPETHGVSSNTYTLGTRFHTTPGNWDFDLEPGWQFGTFDSTNIAAWFVATEGGYTFRQIPTTPRTALGLDIASGSPDPAHRFNQLFPPTYTYLGHLYLFGRPNLIDLHGEVSFNLTHALTLDIAQHFFWRQNVHDALYNLSGAVVRASGTSTAAYVGNEFDIALYWQIDRHLSAYTGYAHFFTGTFIQQTGASEDEDFAYVSATYTF